MFSHVRLLIIPSLVRGQARRFFSEMANPKVFFDVSIGNQPAGRIVMEVKCFFFCTRPPAKVMGAGFSLFQIPHSPAQHSAAKFRNTEERHI